MLAHHRLSTFLFTFLIAIIYAKPARACEFHGGFGPWSSFEPHLRDSWQTNKGLKIKIILPSMIRAKVKKEESFTISYRYTSGEGMPTIQLLINSDPGLTVVESDVNIVGENEQHTYLLKALKSGRYRFVVSAVDVDSKRFPLTSETVYVNVYD